MFGSAVKLSEQIHAVTRDAHAMAVQLRVALMLCPTCKVEGVLDSAIKPFFEFDGYEDREYLATRILPKIVSMGTKDVLWVGVQPFTLRYE